MTFLAILCFFMATPSLISMHPTDQALTTIQSLPPEITTYLVRWQPLEDQLSFTRTCRQFSALSLHAHHLQPFFYHTQPTNVTAYIIPTIGSLAFGMLLHYLEKCKSMPESEQLTYHQAFFSLSALGLSSIAYFALINSGLRQSLHTLWKETIKSEDQERQEAITAQLAHLTTVYQSLAQRMHTKQITTDALHIDYCTHSQARPLFKSAHKLGITTVTIDIQSFYNPEPLKLCTLIAHNTHLKKLTIDHKGPSWSSSNKHLCTDSLCKGLIHNKHLKELKLSWIPVPPKLLVYLTTHESLKKLSLKCCYPDNPHTYLMLANNTTLTHLTISNNNLSDSAVPHILAFMQHNKNLQSLVITDTQLSDAGIHQLTLSPHKPAHFNVYNSYF